MGAIEIKVVKHKLAFSYGLLCKYFVTASRGNNWTWALLDEEEYRRGFDVIKNVMKNNVINSPQDHLFKSKTPWFDGHSVRTDEYPEIEIGEVVYLNHSL